MHAHLCVSWRGGRPWNHVAHVSLRGRRTSRPLAAALPCKVASNHIAKRVATLLKQLGPSQGGVLVRTGQEPAIQTTMEENGRVHAAEDGGRRIMEHSPVTSSQESRLCADISVRHSAMLCMVERAVLLNRGEVRLDGKTAYGRSKSSAARNPGMEFGEAVLWKRRLVGGACGRTESISACAGCLASGTACRSPATLWCLRMVRVGGILYRSDRTVDN